MLARSSSIETLVGRFDPSVFDARRRSTRIRLRVGDNFSDVLIDEDIATIETVRGRPDAVITADEVTWSRLAHDPPGGWAAYRLGRLTVRRNLHVGVGFLAATSGATDPDRVRFRTVVGLSGKVSIIEAGSGPTILALHGLGGTKGRPRASARQQPRREDRAGAGASPPRSSRQARHAGAVARLAPRASVGAAAPARSARARPRPARPAAPRRDDRAHADSRGGSWLDRGRRRRVPARVHDTAGRAAFYAAARQIYLDEPHGKRGFWSRLGTLEPEALFVWGRRDKLVPIASARHVADVLPRARQLELDCGHVPQVERPSETHDALAAFLSEDSDALGPAGSGSRAVAT